MNLRLETQSPQPKSPVKFSVIVPVHNGLGYLRRFVTSLTANWPGAEFEFIFVDDASANQTQKFLGTLNWAKHIRFEDNQGFSAACNAGAELASGDWLFFLNSDIEFTTGWFQALKSCLSQRPSTSAFGFKLLYPDQTVQHAGVITLRDPVSLIPFSMMGIHVGAAPDSLEVNQWIDLDVVTAAALLVKKCDFEAVGGFDEAFFNGGEDVDFCLKLRQLGHTITYCPELTLIHHESKSGPERWLKTLENQREVARRWAKVASPNAVINSKFEMEPFNSQVHSSAPELRAEFTVIIPCLDCLHTLHSCLEAVRNTVGLFTEIMVVDIGSADGTTEFLNVIKDRDPRVSVHSAQDFEAAMTWVLEASSAPHVTLLWPDQLVSPGWLYHLRLAKCMQEDLIGALNNRDAHQNVLGHLPSTLTGEITPKQLSISLAQAQAGQNLTVSKLDPTCICGTRTEIHSAIRKGKLNENGYSVSALCARSVYTHTLSANFERELERTKQLAS